MLRLLLAALLVILAAPVAAATHSLKVTVDAGPHARINTPVSLGVTLPEAFAAAAVSLKDNAGQAIVGQLTAVRLLGEQQAAKPGFVRRELNFIVPSLAADKSVELVAELTTDAASPKEAFAWTDTTGQHSDLAFAGRPVLRYMYAALDESTPENRMATYKPYHHVFDPAGQRLVTKGPGGKFPHHRGLYYGFNRISYAGGKKSADTWHCNKGESQSHEGFVNSEAGPVLGRHLVRIAWHGQDKAVFAEELREMTAWNTPGGTLIEFASRLDSKAGPVKLDGDPQHAGFQFRASQEVPDKTAAQTYYLRPDGKGEPGKFRNWPADKGHANLPWNALSFVLGEQRYTCCYLDRPQNPKEARFSERDYGRFGSYFEATIDDGKPLDLNYRIWLQTGEMDVPGVQRLADDFVAGPVVK